MVVSDAIHMLSKEENDDENIRSAHQSDHRNNAPTTSDDDDDDDSSDRINIMDGLSSEVLAALLEFQLGGSSTNEEDNDTDTNACIRHVEGGPAKRTNVEIEEIRDRAEAQTVNHIP